MKLKFLLTGLTVALWISVAPAANAQVVFGGGGSGTLCVNNEVMYISNSFTDCNAGPPKYPVDITINDPTTFAQSVTFDGGNISFSGATTAFGGGTTTFNNSVTMLQNVTTNGITNTGTISTGNVGTNSLTSATATITSLIGVNTTVSNSLTVNLGANVNFGGNVLHSVAAGVAATDAVNVSQLNAATSGITADVTALETASAAHTAQIASLETTNTVQDTRISAVEGVNTAQASQITAIQALNTTQSSQIGALQAAQDLVSDRVESLFDLRSMDRRDMKQGIAAAMSMAPAPMPSGPGKVAYAVNGASFRGQYAVGGSMTYRLNTQAPTALNVGFSYAGNKNNGVRVGIAGEF